MLPKILMKRGITGFATRSAQTTRHLSGLATATATQQSASPDATATKEQTKTASESEIKVEFYEHCKSGSDRQVAEMKITAYGKGATEPDEQMMVADGESKNVRSIAVFKVAGLILKQLGHTSNPLNISSANPSASESCDSSQEGSCWDQKKQVSLFDGLIGVLGTPVPSC
jgi:hypothetical protein